MPTRPLSFQTTILGLVGWNTAPVEFIIRSSATRAGQCLSGFEPFNPADSRNISFRRIARPVAPHTMILRKSNLLLMSTLLSSLFGGSLAQAAATSSSSANGASSTPTVHKVTVGANGFSYSPNTTFANPGDTIVFEFFPTNHSVIRAEYTGSSACGSSGCNPCVPYELIHPGEAGFSSGNFLTQSVDPSTVCIPASHQTRQSIPVLQDADRWHRLQHGISP